MTRESHPAHTFLPGFILAACVALPAGASAQTAPPATAAGSLGAAMAEARRTPFHDGTGAEGIWTVQPGSPFAIGGDQLAPDSAGGPSFHWIFWPTAIVTYLSDLAFLFGALNCIDTVERDVDCTLGLVMGTGAMILGPPIAARIAGGSFGKGLLGSLAGIGLTAAVHLGLSLPDEAAWLYPPAHALVTTAAAMR